MVFSFRFNIAKRPHGRFSKEPDSLGLVPSVYFLLHLWTLCSIERTVLDGGEYHRLRRSDHGFIPIRDHDV